MLGLISLFPRTLEVLGSLATVVEMTLVMLEEGLSETLSAASSNDDVGSKEIATPSIAHPHSVKTDEFGFPLRLFTKVGSYAKHALLLMCCTGFRELFSIHI